MTDDLIARLADDLKPVPAGALQRRLLLLVLLGLAVAMPLMAMSLGFRPDLREATGTAMFWIKSGYTAGLALAGIWAVEQLSRPGHRGNRPLRMVLILVAATALASIIDYALAPADARPNMLMGSSALLCPFFIMALSVPFLVTGIAFMRRAAPTRLTVAGAAVGLAAGALGAWVYSFHCTEGGLPFLALWYSLGIAAVTAAGALAGRILLRW
ncbi:MAG: NrsF family protein [Hyphomicrobiaceae bacterium]